MRTFPDEENRNAAHNRRTLKNSVCPMKKIYFRTSAITEPMALEI